MHWLTTWEKKLRVARKVKQVHSSIGEVSTYIRERESKAADEEVPPKYPASAILDEL